MLNNEAAAAAAIQVSPPATRTATFQNSWLDVRQYEGDIVAVQTVGTVGGTTPTLDGSFEDADDISGTGAAALSGASFGQVTASSSTKKLVIGAGRSRGFIRYVATIGGTTPSFPMAVVVLSRPKTV